MNINRINLTQLGKAAIYYANLYKWHVFPARSRGKEPLTKHGLLDATIDQIQLYKWWSQFPQANVAIRTGRESNLIVIDVDGEEGEYTLEQLTKQYEMLPKTVESLTGSGGRHILFRYPNIEGIHIKSKVGWLGEHSKLDIRAEGGYIVAPPSIHPNGHVYEWELSSRPNEVAIAEIPKWLLQLLVTPKKASHIKKPSSYWSNILAGVNEGGRNNAATSLAGYLFRRYLDVEVILEIMEMWNERNNPPLSNKELEKIILSVARKERARRNEKSGEFRIG